MKRGGRGRRGGMAGARRLKGGQVSQKGRHMGLQGVMKDEGVGYGHEGRKRRR